MNNTIVLSMNAAATYTCANGARGHVAPSVGDYVTYSIRRVSGVLAMVLCALSSPAYAQYNTAYAVDPAHFAEEPDTMTPWSPDGGVVVSVRPFSLRPTLQKLTATGGVSWDIEVTTTSILSITAMLEYNSILYVTGQEKININGDQEAFAAAIDPAANVLVWASRLQVISQAGTVIPRDIKIGSLGASTFLLIVGEAVSVQHIPWAARVDITNGNLDWGKTYQDASIIGFRSVSQVDSGDTLAVGLTAPNNNGSVRYGLAALLNTTNGNLVAMNRYSHSIDANETLMTMDHAQWSDDTALVTGRLAKKDQFAVLHDYAFRAELDTNNLSFGNVVTYRPANANPSGQSIATNAARDQWAIGIVKDAATTWILTNGPGSRQLCPLTRIVTIEILPLLAGTRPEYVATLYKISPNVGAATLWGVAVSGWDADPGSCSSELEYDTDEAQFTAIEVVPNVDDFEGDGINIDFQQIDSATSYSCGNKLSC